MPRCFLFKLPCAIFLVFVLRNLRKVFEIVLSNYIQIRNKEERDQFMFSKTWKALTQKLYL